MRAIMSADLKSLLIPNKTIDRNGIFVAHDIAEKTVWDTLAVENPTNAVISAEDETAAQKKSEAQILEIKQHIKPTDVLLDYGSGYGRIAKYLLPATPIAGYIGMDSSFEMLSIFKERYDKSSAEQETPVLLLSADIHTAPLKDHSVDMVVVCAVFLHNHKDIVKRAMDEIKRVLKPGGTLLVYSSFPRVWTAMGIQGQLYQMILNVLGKPYKNGPVRYYRKSEVMKLLGGFSEVEVKSVGLTVVPKTLIFLSGPFEKMYRIGFANPLNGLLSRIIPDSLAPSFAVHYDIVAVL